LVLARTLFLVCYDVANHNRLAKVHKTVQAYVVGGQKSFYECWLTPDDLLELRKTLAGVIMPSEDRVHFFQLDPRIKPLFFGQAKRTSMTPFLIV
jgi:CRISPR-associated protein Cas2